MPPQQPSLGVHSVLYHTDVPTLERSLSALNRAAEYGWFNGTTGAIHVRYGDCSPMPAVTAAQLDEWRVRFASLAEITVDFFGENLGHGGAQNRLAAGATTDYLVFVNPDVLVGTRTLSELASVLADPSIGIVEAKQIPLEHPKDYDRATGATSWCSGACSMLRNADFHQVGGFDATSFFMYCDDVDLSWRLRARGLGAAIQPAAIVFHDKRLSREGAWVPTDSERYYSVEAALILAHKWSRPDLVESIAGSIEQSDGAVEARALAQFRTRENAGTLPIPLDADHRTADFTGGTYGEHRFTV